MAKPWGVAARATLLMTATALAVLLLCDGATAQAQDCVGPSPRTVPVKVVNIHNNTGRAIWAVLETAKQDLLDANGHPHDRWLQAEFNPTPGLYASTYLYRAYVNPIDGIRARGSVSVTIPLYTQLAGQPCPFEADQYIDWWRALRIYIYDDAGAIKNAYDTDRKSAVVVSPPNGSAVPLCPSCAAPLVIYKDLSGGDGHGVSLSPNDPSQLLEFTFATVEPAPKPLKIDHGFVDYDISSVDQVYLPVAMDPLNNPYIGFIGSIMDRDEFNDRLALFQKDFGWPKYKWPSYVTNQQRIRLPGTYNVMKEIDHPGAPPPFVPAGADIKELPVIQAMEELWDDCCGDGWPDSLPTCRKPSPSSATCNSMARVADLFEKNYANYKRLCASPTALTRDFMMSQVYGWVPFNSCILTTGPSTVVNELKDTPDIGGTAGYHAISNGYIDLQYHSPPDPRTYGDFNRYVELIHDPKYLRVGEYAFSIDDAAGNMLEVGDGINLTVGGAPGLGNKNPYDPWRFFMFNVGAARESGPEWTKYRICTDDEGSSCPSLPPNRDMKVAARRDGIIEYSGIKLGAVKCPCVVVLQDSNGTLYRVLVKKTPAPPPVHPLDKEGDPPTADDPSWVAKDGDNYANVVCADSETSFDWCRNLQPAKIFDELVQRTVYHVNTSAPMVPQSGIRFEPGDLTATLSRDKTMVTVEWPKAVTQPPRRLVTYELTLWSLPDCPSPTPGRCDGHDSIPLARTCDDSSTTCHVPLANTVPPLTASTLKGLSVVAKDPDGHLAVKQANFLPPLGGTPPLSGQIRSGSATGVGLAADADGRGKGSVKMSGVFTFTRPLDLAAPGLKVTILNALNEAGGAGELALDTPLTLTADSPNTAKSARFRTAPGTTPQATVTIGSKGRGQYTFAVQISGATIDLPGGCPQTELTTAIGVDDGASTPFSLFIDQPWQCIQRGGSVEYLKTP